eukprot:55609-Ditylum_brightwellii.AAC.1
MTETKSAACKSHSKREGSERPNAKQMKMITMNGDELHHDVIQMVEDVTIENTMGIATIP